MQVETNYEQGIIRALNKIIPECTFILSGGNGVEIAPPYALVSMLTEQKVGMSEKTSTSKLDANNKSWQLVQQQYEINYAITFHGKLKSEAEKWARYLSISLESDFTHTALNDNGLSFVTSNVFPRAVVNNNTVVAYTNDTIDLTIRTARSEWFPVEVIDRVEITGDLSLDNDPQTNDVEVVVKWQ